MTKLSLKQSRNRHLEQDVAELEFVAKPKLTQKQVKAINLPAFVRVKWVGSPDTINLLYDRQLNSIALDDKGRPYHEGIDGPEQIMGVVKQLEWPKLPARK